jgi:hypothetical protein
MQQFDINEFAQMFDAALASDNPSVKKALRNFMMVAAIVHAEEQTGEPRAMGPLERLVKKVFDLESIVKELQYNRTTTYPTKSDYWKDYYGSNPTWVYSSNTSTPSTTQSWSYPINHDMDDTTIKQLMKDLKFDDK